MTTVPLGDGQISITCTHCGPVMVAHEDENFGQIIVTHLWEHGCDLSQMEINRRNAE